MDRIKRNIKHIVKSGNLLMGIDHVLVAFPSVLLMAKMLSDNYFTTDTISLIMLTTGLSTIVFAAITKSAIPILMGPSFAFIGYVSSAMTLGGQNLELAYYHVLCGYLLAGALFMAIAVFYQSATIRKYVKLTLPDALIGPLISLIGLDLLETAIDDAGFNLIGTDHRAMIIALATVVVIIFATVTKRRVLKHASILIGVSCGCIVSLLVLQRFDVAEMTNSIIVWPDFRGGLYRLFGESSSFKEVQWLNAFLAVLPATVVVFSENITKLTLVEKMVRQDEQYNKKQLSRFYPNSLIGHASSFILSILLGSVPNTVYAQNVALMGIHNVDASDKRKMKEEKNTKISKYYNNISIYPYIIAGVLFILFSFFGFFQNILSSIPKPVFGGVELFVFGLIAAQGVQLLVDRKVNYRKVTNQIITSATLLAGLSGIYIDLGVAEIKGLSLAMLVGLVLNIVFGVLAHFGWTNEKLSMIEVVEACVSSFSKKDEVAIKSNEIPNEILYDYIHYENRTDHVIGLVNHITSAQMTINRKTIISVEHKDGMISMEISPYCEKFVELANDFDVDTVAIDDTNTTLMVTINEKMSVHRLKQICKALA